MRMKTAHVGDRVVYEKQSKTAGVVVEIHDPPMKGKHVKVHWNIPPEGKNLHRNGRGSYTLSELKIKKAP